MEILRTEHVTKRYAGHTALCDVSITVPRGSIYGLLGPNGAGKTTLIRIINRITAPDEGKVWFNGSELAPDDIYKIGYLPEERGLYKKMKVGEQAVYFAMLKGMSRKDATAQLKKWFIHFDIAGWWDRKVDELSKGMAQKIQFIVTVLHRPQLLILDEPLSGFDPVNANLIKQEIMKLREEGSTIIFSTHNMASVEEICDYITLINKSRNILSGEVSQVRRSHGENIFEVEFVGDQEKIKDGIGRMANVLDQGEGFAGHKMLKLHIPDKQDVREVISFINSTSEISTFREIIPSMNDIFLKAVAGENTISEE